MDRCQFSDLQGTSKGRRLLRVLRLAEKSARARHAAENRVTRAYRQAAVHPGASDQTGTNKPVGSTGSRLTGREAASE